MWIWPISSHTRLFWWCNDSLTTKMFDFRLQKASFPSRVFVIACTIRYRWSILAIVLKAFIDSSFFLVSKDNQHKWLSQLSPSVSAVSVPFNLPSSLTSNQIIIDVYLGSHLKSPAPVYCLLPGWLGSFPCDKGTSYEHLIRDYIPSCIPVGN